MSEQQKHTELLNEQLSSEKSNTNNNPYSREIQYERNYNDTGIYIRGNTEEGYYATAGQYRISPMYATPGEVITRLDNRDWNLIMWLITAMVQFMINADLPVPKANNENNIPKDDPLWDLK